MKKTTKNRLIFWVSVILSVLLLAAVIGIIVKFTNGGKEKFKTFYLVYGGEEISASQSSMHFEAEEQSFQVKYMFPSGDEQARDFSVRIEASGSQGTKFHYTVNGKKFTFEGGTDLTAAFSLEKGENGFIFVPPATVRETLAKLYPDRTVVITDEYIIREPALYRLTVTSYDGSVQYSIVFSVGDFKPTDLELKIEPPGVVFG